MTSISIYARVIVAAALSVAAAQSSLSAQQQGGPPMGFGGPGGEEQKLVKQFDKDGDKVLNSAERKAAKAFLAANGGSGMRMGGRRGMPGMGQGESAAVGKGAALAPKDVASFKDAALFDAQTYRTFFLTFEDTDWEDQLMVFKNTDIDVPATLVVDGRTFRDVGVHFHGASSFMMVPAGQKHSFNIKLDFVHDDQQLGGQRTLILLNSSGDATMMRPLLYTRIAREFIPASKANLARIAINGESWGAFVNIQHFSKDFIRDWYNTTDGARWKVPGNPGARGGLEYLGADAAAYKLHYEIKSKDDPKSWASFIELTRVLNQTPADKLEAALSPIFDIDGALRFLAIDNALVNDDGYWTRSSDYSVYLDTTGKFHVFPWDTNETFAADSIGSSGRGGGRGPGGPGGPGFGGPGGPGFGGRPGGRGFGDDQNGMPEFARGGRGGRGGPGGPGGMGGSPTLDPLVGLNDSAKPLRSKLFAVPAMRAKYLQYVHEIATKWLDWKTLEPWVNDYRALIDADMKTDPKKLDTYEGFVSGIDALKKFAGERRAYLLAYVDPSVKK